MSALQQTLPLNHPPPRQSAPQPPLKKPRINAKPKLTTHQLTQPSVIQSALRIGRQARANAPEPGQEHKALDNLLKNMQGWATQLAPQYTLAEFVLAAHAISGNRELRPILAEFRLAELRDVNAENDPANDAANPTQSEQVDTQPENLPQPNGAAVHADVGPVEADVGPIEADVGPDDDDWDELDLVPDEAVEVRPIPKNQPSVPAATSNENDTEKGLSPDIEAKIEQNRRAALERRKAVIARLRADKEAEEKRSTQADDGTDRKSATNPLNTQKEKSKPDGETDKVPDTSPSDSEKGKHLSQEPNPSKDNPSSGALKKDDLNAIGKQAKDATSKADVSKEAQTDVPGKPDLSDHRSKKQDEGDERQENEVDISRDLTSTESTQNACVETDDKRGVEKSDSASQKERGVDQDVDMDILTEFEGGDDV